ncbi:hypothetical protein [Hymenobacter daeguensis]
MIIDNVAFCQYPCEMNARLQLVSYVAEKAQYFMRKTGALYPFAVILDKEGEVRQLLLSWEEEYPNARELATALEAVIKVRLRFDSILGGVVCNDVLYRAIKDTTKLDALQMKLLMKEEVEYYYQPYVVAEKSIVFAEIVQDHMTYDRLSELSE